MIYYKTPLHLQKVFHYLGYKKGTFPIAEKIAKKQYGIGKILLKSVTYS